MNKLLCLTALVGLCLGVNGCGVAALKQTKSVTFDDFDGKFALDWDILEEN